ncbi:MAG: hypothetical protein ABIQ40_04125 [Bacteroidia bacterium]
MEHKSRQRKTEDEKTLSLKITGLRKLCFLVIGPVNGVIDIVNSADNGRVCSLTIDDFDSVGDAKSYAEIIRIAPELLNHYLADAKTLEKVVKRMGGILAKKKVKNNKKSTGE